MANNLSEFTIPQNRDFSILITIKETRSGSPVDLTGNEFKALLTLGIGDETPIELDVSETDLTNGIITVNVLHTDTSAITANFTRRLEVARKVTATSIVKDVLNAVVVIEPRAINFDPPA